MRRVAEDPVKKASRPIPLNKTLNNRPPPRVPLIRNLLDRGEIAILASDPNVGKTPLISQMALSVASGTEFLRFKTKKVRVLIIDLESGAERCHKMIQRQSEHLGVDAGPNIDLFVRGNPKDPNSQELESVLEKSEYERLDWLTNLSTEGGYGLIIIDTALQLIPFEAADERHTRRFLKTISHLRRTKPYPAILFTHHLRKPDSKKPRPSLLKDPQAWFFNVLGSVAWISNTDVRLGLSQDEGYVVLAGFRRGESEVGPLFLDQNIINIHGEPAPTHWVRASNTDLATNAFSRTEKKYFDKLPFGKPVTWEEAMKCDIPRTSLHRILIKGERIGVIKVEGTRRKRTWFVLPSHGRELGTNES